MRDAEDDWTQIAEERDFVARNDVKNVLGKDVSFYADDSSLLSGCVRTIRCRLHSMQKEAPYYSLFLNVGGKKKRFSLELGLRAAPDRAWKSCSTGSTGSWCSV